MAQHIYLPKDDAINKISTIHKDQFFVKMSEAAVAAAYGQDEIYQGVCGLYFMCFRSFDWLKPLLLDRPETKKENLLAREMINHSRRPLSVRALAREFTDKIMKIEDEVYIHNGGGSITPGKSPILSSQKTEKSTLYIPKADKNIYHESAFWQTKNFIGMHWRYDIKDFGTHCGREKHLEQGEQRPMCRMLLNGKINATKIAEKIKDWYNVRKKSEDSYGVMPTSIYIAAPPSEKNLILEIQKYLNRHLGLEVYFRHDLLKFIERKFKNSCSAKVYQNQIHDYISQVEQELCMISRIFIRSESSSWSLGARLVQKGS